MNHVRLFALFLLLSVPLFAQPKKDPPKPAPKVLYSVPLAVVAGQKTKILLRGNNLDTATEAKTATMKCSAKLLGKGRKATVPNNYPASKLGDTECEVELETPQDFNGNVSLLIITPNGESQSYSVFVAPKLVVETEPNDSFKGAQEITLPTFVEGTFHKERDVDLFHFAGTAGQQVSIEVIAAKLGSPTDAILTLYGPDEKTLQIVDDVDGQPDPKHTITLPKTGKYWISLQEANDLGGTPFGYRLRVDLVK